MIFNYNAKWETGIEELDIQNSRLFALVKRLRNLQKQTKCDPKKNYSEFKDILERLNDYLAVHFLQEEIILRDDDSSYESHHADHVAFEDQVHIWMASLYGMKDLAGISHLAGEMERFLSTWTLRHIWRMDLHRAEEPPLPETAPLS